MSTIDEYGVLFPTSVVGSMPRSDFVKDLIASQESLPVEVYARRMEAAIRYIVALQEQAGVDILVKGSKGEIKTLTVSNLDEEKIDLKVDYFLPFFGLSSELGPIKNWELEIER